MDFTQSVKDVPKEYGPWLIMSVEDVDTDAKTAELYVNAEENQKRLDKKRSIAYNT